MSDYHTTNNTLRVTPILNVTTETPTTKTYTFKDTQCAKAKPGQYLMLWIPNVDEIPLSIQNTDGNTASVTVKAIGQATHALHKLKTGDKIGIRGPFGNHFTPHYGKILLAAGGTGTAPLLYLAKQLTPKTKQLTFVTGAKTKTELLHLNQLNTTCTPQNIIATTEDGTHGQKCLATQPIERLLTQTKYDKIYTCGPEPMIQKIFQLAEQHGVPVEASLERLIRCSIGICGNCTIGKYRVCRDGPVFNTTQLREIKNELGTSKLDFNGNKIHI